MAPPPHHSSMAVLPDDVFSGTESKPSGVLCGEHRCQRAEPPTPPPPPIPPWGEETEAQSSHKLHHCCGFSGVCSGVVPPPGPLPWT